MDRLLQAKQRHAAIVAEMRTLNDAASDSGRDLTPAQHVEYEALDAKRIAAAATLKREERIAQHERTAPAVRSSSDRYGMGGGRVTARERFEDDPSGGLGDLGSLLVHVAHAAKDPGNIPPELAARAVSAEGEGLAFLMPPFKATVGSDEQGEYSNPYGGFGGPKTLLPGMLSVGFEGDPTDGRTTQLPMQTPTVEMVARTDKNHTTSVSGGFTTTRTAETVPAASSRSEMEKVTLKATARVLLFYTSWELLQDNPQLVAELLSRSVPEQFAADILREKLYGLGGGQYTGAVNADCTVTMTRDTSSRILGTDVVAMASRCWGYPRAIWIANHDCRAELLRAGLAAYDAQAATPLTGAGAMYQPSLQDGFPDMLLGRPIFYSEYAKTLGTSGDLFLGDWSQYLEGVYQPLRTAESMHVRFVNRETAFQIWRRDAGAPWWRSALTPNQSATTLSPFVKLS